MHSLVWVSQDGIDLLQLLELGLGLLHSAHAGQGMPKLLQQSRLHKANPAHLVPRVLIGVQLERQAVVGLLHIRLRGLLG